MSEPRRRALAEHFFGRLATIIDQAEFTDADRAEALRRLVLDLAERAAEPDRLHFSTSYARLSYLAHKYDLPKQLLYREREFRRGSRRLAEADARRADELLRIGYRVAGELILAFFGGTPPAYVAELLAAPYPTDYERPAVRRTFYQLRVLALEIDEGAGLLHVGEERQPERVYAIPFTDPELADGLAAQAVRILRDVTGPYVLLNLIRAELRDDDRLYPTQIIVDPDYLINVTEVAGSFGGRGSYQPWTSLARRLIPFDKAPALVRGNIVNGFLDALVHDPAVEFSDLLPTIFGMQPLALCLFDDQTVRRMVQELRHHFTTLRRVVREGLGELGIDRERVLLEPSFLSPAYGLQGRLDLLQSEHDLSGEDARTSIIELKSSKIFAPNRHGIKHDNFIQTLLYDLMINRALGREANVSSYICYSIDYERPLRYAPPEFQQQLEALAARNQLLAVEVLLGKLGAGGSDLREQTDRLLGRLQPFRFRRLSSFHERDHRRVLDVYGALSDLERRYFGAFLGFVAREQRLAKVGEQKRERVNGLASLWLDERRDKVERFELLDGLTFGGYAVDRNELTLRREGDDDRLTKFRQGDIVALYTTREQQAAPGDAVRSQVFKSTVVAVDQKTVLLRPRNPQLSADVFRRGAHWSIERDVLDSSFRNHYQGLFTWASTERDFRDRWLGLAPPGRADPFAGQVGRAVTQEQENMLRQIVTAPHYFLLWGPPGTGKTSRVLHHLVRHRLAESDESLLLVAYTNRAVDEICESIEAIHTPQGEPFRDYLRIGSRYGADERFSDRLLQLRSQDARTRAELTELIRGVRVVVGTVASVGSKTELFRLKHFDRIIVDEASQIPEPLLAGLLPRAPRALLIGDHNQLPAVVQQPPEDTRVHDTALRDAGVTDLATSLFERLYLTAKRRGWDWAYDQLRQQGRMHQDIMTFPALHFYGSRLEVLPEGIPHRSTQLAPLPQRPGLTGLAATLATQRLVFLPTDTDAATPDPKLNRHEARLMVKLVHTFTELYAGSAAPLRPGDVGIITPYRAQIAQIRKQLLLAGLDPADYTVDTVERYQGSAKRIVLMSLCANEAYQMDSLSQLSEEGVDRKLNVAMTRAREHLVLVGCPDVLRQSTVYAELLDFIAAAAAPPPPAG